MKLSLFKVAKSDACIRPLFTNPVTNYNGAQFVSDEFSHLVKQNGIKHTVSEVPHITRPRMV